MNSMTRAKRVALGAVLTALALLFLCGAFLLPTARIGLIAAAGLFPAAALISGGAATGFLTYAATGILALLMLPDKGCAVIFLLCFGAYPLLKHYIEQMRKLPAEWLLKLVVCEGMLSLFWFVLRGMFLQTLTFGDVAVWMYYLAGTAVFVVYDLGVSKLVSFYMARVDAQLRKG